MEDQTIQDIEKIDKTVSKYHDDLIDLDPVPLTHVPVHIIDEVQDDQDVPEVPPDVPLRRSTRDCQPSTWYSVDEYVLLTDGGELECYAEAMEDEHKTEWVDAMQDEMKSLHENHKFELVKLPKGKRALKNKWVYRVKQKQHTTQP
ncbi:hypothetical protein LWI29_025988 [Acer saccharum]|uniref:Reverse transcriptase n=1 Tax=Acer saccharum TaxID=4024 RepID=A0AA39VSJ7_ACESA|nr:hypothetical protein LWI29_025988 [Acer saccharum]